PIFKIHTITLQMLILAMVYYTWTGSVFTDQFPGYYYSYDDDDYRYHPDYLWGVYQTKVLKAQLKIIDSITKRRRLYKEAKTQKLSIQDYEKKYMSIDESKITNQMVQEFLLRRNISKVNGGPDKARTLFIDYLKRKRFDYFIEKFLLALPIELGTTKPNYQVPLLDDKDPILGSPRPRLEMVLVTDGLQKNPLDKLFDPLELKTLFPGLRMRYLSIVSEDLPGSVARGLAYQCLWEVDKKSFWKVFDATSGLFGGDIQGPVRDSLGADGGQRKAYDQCLIAESNKLWVKKSKKRSQQMGLRTGAYVFIGGEVHSLSEGKERLHKMIRRHLEIPDAGRWWSRQDL
ncbi:MAG: hypothetical protein AAF203_10195, partial [Pseudomonadota bacterium]